MLRLNRKALLHKSTGLTHLAGTALFLSAGLFTQAHAQTTAGAKPAAAQKVAQGIAQAEADKTQPERIIVTGSRIRSREYTAASKVQIITASESLAAGRFSAAEILQGSSVAAGSEQVNSSLNKQDPEVGGLGINTIGLRGFAARRTLVLLNGRRMGPSGTGGGIGPADLATLPTIAVNRYEILLDGASSVYGSDAVAGVVNVITRTDFKGLEFKAGTSSTEKGGGDRYNYAAIYGRDLDRGHLTASVEYSVDTGLREGDRPDLSCAEDYLFKKSGERGDTTNASINAPLCWNLIESDVGIYDFGGTKYIPSAGDSVDNMSGQNIPDWKAARFADYGARYARAYKRFQNNTIKSPSERGTFFLEGNYRPAWALGAEFYTEVLASKRNSSQSWLQLFQPTFAPSNPANPFKDYVFPNFYVDPSAKQSVTLGKAIIGARQKWLGWNWDGFISHSRSSGRAQLTVTPKDRLWASIGFDDSKFEAVERCGAGAPAGCVPWDPFSSDALYDGYMPEAVRNYLRVKEVNKTRFDQTMFEISGTGDLFKLPGGVVQGAIGIAARRDSIDDRPGPYRGSDNAYYLNPLSKTKGTDTVKEIFVEAQFPLLKDATFAKELELTTSGRYTAHKKAGEGGTYKVGLFWQPIAPISFRATQGTSFRAPTVSEQFRGTRYYTVGPRSVDPCLFWGPNPAKDRLGASPLLQKNCAADGVPPDLDFGGDPVRVVSRGNPNLRPETSLAKTYGFVITPPRLNLAIAVDFWDITIRDGITSNGLAVVGACYTSFDFPNSGFCRRIRRDPNTHRLIDIDASPVNSPEESASGVDFNVDWSRRLDFGTLSTSLNATNSPKRVTSNYIGDPTTQYKGTIGEPKWVGNFQTSLKSGKYVVTHTLNYIGGVSNQGWQGEDGTIASDTRRNPETLYGKNFIKPWTTQDISVRYDLGTLSLTAGITNLTDQETPRLSYSDDAGAAARFGSHTSATQYDAGLYGRAFFANITKKF